MDTNYKIDYDLFETLEIIKIIEFFRLIESTKTKPVNKDLLLTKYREYQNILCSKTLEKQYDKMLFEKSRISIYRVMEPILKGKSNKI